MHVILLTSLFGDKRGNVGDRLPVNSQEEADELVNAGIARPDTEADLKRQLAEYQAREQQQLQAAALAEEQARESASEAEARAKASEAEAAEEAQAGKQVKPKAGKV